MNRSISLRSHHSSRNSRSNNEQHEGEIVDNPNSYGLWGRYQDAAAAMITNDQTSLNARAILGRQAPIQSLPERRRPVDGGHMAVPEQSWQREDVAPEDDPNSPPEHHQHKFTRFQLTSRHKEVQDQDNRNSTGSRDAEELQEAENRNSHDGVDAPFASYSAPPAIQIEPDTQDHASIITDGEGEAGQSQNHQRRSGMNYLNTFDMVHDLSTHAEQFNNQIPIRLGHLFKRPLIRQWVLDDKLYQEVDDRQPSQFELFFDLVMVGIIHKLADGAAEAATGLNVAKFILCFYPAWSVWTDLRSYVNVSGTDDVLQRMYTLLSMVLLVGYAANATGIQIEKEVEERFDHENFQSATTETEGTLKKRTLFTLASTIGSTFVRRWEDGGSYGLGTGSMDHVPLKLVRKIGHTNYWFAEGWHSGISGAIGFYLVAKGCRLALYFIYGIFLPKFRKALWLNGISLVVISCIYLPIMIIDLPGTIVVLICTGIIAELAIRYLVAALLQIMHGRSKHRGRKTYMPAYSLPHMMERTTLFTILVTGETIMNATFVAKADEFGPKPIFWRAAMSMTIAFMMMWLYFDVDSSRTYVHGLKRHWFTSITYTHLHFPLCASLILLSSTLTAIIHREAINIRHIWLFSGSISIAMLCMGILGVLHKSLDRWGSSLIPKSARIGSRFFLAGFFIILPFIHHWTSAEFLGVHAGILVLAVAFETFGKLGAIGRVYDPIRAEELRQQRMINRRNMNPSPTSTPRSPNGTFKVECIDPPNKKSKFVRRAKSFTSAYSSSSRSQIDSEKQLRSSISHRHLSTMIGSGLRRLNKGGKVKGPGKRESWHEYDDLTNEEIGENDVGVESELGHLRSKRVATGERWAYVAT